MLPLSSFSVHLTQSDELVKLVNSCVHCLNINNPSLIIVRCKRIEIFCYENLTNHDKRLLVFYSALGRANIKLGMILGVV